MTCAKGSGVYKLTCVASRKFYVGSAKNFKRRWAEHRRLLAAGRHVNPKLQAAWEKYGADAFEFSVLEYCAYADVLEREQAWINRLQPTFNIALVAGRPPGVVWTADMRRRKSAETRGKRNHFYGKQHTEATRAAASTRHKRWLRENGHPMDGREWSGDRVAHSETMKRLHREGVLRSWQKGRPFSDEQKVKQRATIAAHGGRAGSNNPRFNAERTTQYRHAAALVATGTSVKDACAQAGIPRITYYKRKAAGLYDT